MDIPNQNEITSSNPQNQNGSSDESKLYKILGGHTNSVIVGLLFLCTLFAFIIYLIIYNNKLNDVLTTGFFSLLSTLGGFFIASLKKD